MRAKHWCAIGLAALLGQGTAQAQSGLTLPAAKPTTAQVVPAASGIGTVKGSQIIKVQASAPGDGKLPADAKAAPEAIPAPAGAPVTAGTCAAEECKCADAPAWGPTPPEEVKCLMNTALGEPFKECCSRIYGWMDTGYTYASGGPGLLSVEPRENRFGNELLFNQLALVIDRPLKGGCECSWGYNATLWVGADPAELRPEGGFTTTDPRFGVDFRQLYVSAHLPVLTEGGLDVQAGRMGTIIGYESALAPYRPFYSNDYQWFYAEDGAWTGVLTNLHVNKQLDVLNGITMGANTFFTIRGNGPCYIGQINYWLQEDKTTLLSVGTQQGNNCIFADPEGSWISAYEVRLQHNWSKCLLQVVQSNFGWEYSVPGKGTVNWGGIYNIFVYQLSPCLSTGFRLSWFDDPQGVLTGISGNYEEVTLGLDYHPYKWMQLRPEIRGDFNNNNEAFGNVNTPTNRSQLTIAMDLLLKF